MVRKLFHVPRAALLEELVHKEVQEILVILKVFLCPAGVAHLQHHHVPKRVIAVLSALFVPPQEIFFPIFHILRRDHGVEQEAVLLPERKEAVVKIFAVLLLGELFRVAPAGYAVGQAAVDGAGEL